MRVVKDAAERKGLPLYSGCVAYFPDALIAVAELSRIGNDQHNPGKPLHWDRSKSGDELDALMRHLVDCGTVDTDGVRHSTKVAWRALANLQKEIEEAKNDPEFCDGPEFEGWDDRCSQSIQEIENDRSTDNQVPLGGDIAIDINLERGCCNAGSCTLADCPARGDRK